jgi:D(-)-tartrate dehydratase
VQDSRNLIRYGGMRPDRDWLQMDPALSYGPTEFIRMVLDAENSGWTRDRFVPRGGHQLNLALAAGLERGLGTFTPPDDGDIFAASKHPR